MIETIKYCYDHRILVSLYFDKERSETHFTGYISDYDENEILISHINKRGNYDGYILCKLADLYRIDYDGQYENKIENLSLLKKQHINLLKLGNDVLLYRLLDFAINKSLIITVSLYDNEFSGLIEKYDDTKISLRLIDDFGNINGVTVIPIQEIFTILCDTDYEQDLKLLAEQNTGDGSVCSD